MVINTNNKINDNLFVEAKSPDLYLVMERLTDESSDFWGSYFSEIAEFARMNFDSQDKTRKFMRAGYQAIHDSMVSNIIYPHDFWILFASNVPVTEQNPHPEDQIEMVCTVSTAEGAPFTTHQGITRTIQSVEGRLINHKNLSIDLHRFGARVMKHLHPEKVFIVNCPMPKMEEIFRNALGRENVHVGLDEDWLKSDHYKNRIAACGPDPLIRLGPKWSSFLLKDLKGNVLLQLNREQMDNQYSWYFSRSTSLSNYNNIIAIALDILTRE